MLATISQRTKISRCSHQSRLLSHRLNTKGYERTSKRSPRSIFGELSKLYKKRSKKQRQNTEICTIQSCFLADEMGWASACRSSTTINFVTITITNTEPHREGESFHLKSLNLKRSLYADHIVQSDRNTWLSSCPFGVHSSPEPKNLTWAHYDYCKLMRKFTWHMLPLQFYHIWQ